MIASIDCASPGSRKLSRNILRCTGRCEVCTEVDTAYGFYGPWRCRRVGFRDMRRQGARGGFMPEPTRSEPTRAEPAADRHPTNNNNIHDDDDNHNDNHNHNHRS